MDRVSPALTVNVVHGLDQWLQAVAIRAEVYIGEQTYSFAEEFDGLDLDGATHLVAYEGGEPVGACRIRWFAGFAKLERVAVKRARRSGRVPRALWRAAAELAARKGYGVMLGYIERSLLPFWQRAAGFAPRALRPSFVVSGREFVEAIAPLERHPDAVDLDSPAFRLLGDEVSSVSEAIQFEKAS
jgi:predicted GNAT family N-acyltransferase